MGLPVRLQSWHKDRTQVCNLNYLSVTACSLPVTLCWLLQGRNFPNEKHTYLWNYGQRLKLQKKKQIQIINKGNLQLLNCKWDFSWKNSMQHVTMICIKLSSLKCTHLWKDVSEEAYIKYQTWIQLHFIEQLTSNARALILCMIKQTIHPTYSTEKK